MVRLLGQEGKTKAGPTWSHDMKTQVRLPWYQMSLCRRDGHTAGFHAAADAKQYKGTARLPRASCLILRAPHSLHPSAQQQTLSWQHCVSHRTHTRPLVTRSPSSHAATHRMTRVWLSRSLSLASTHSLLLATHSRDTGQQIHSLLRLRSSVATPSSHRGSNTAFLNQPRSYPQTSDLKDLRCLQ
jgi:hypothetical protein